jgi:hypothetical protein
MCRRSMVMVSGMVKTQRKPRAAAAKARPMPVLPLVGSTMTMPGRSVPRSRASSIMATPMRSFTDAYGLKPSCLTSTSASPSRTSRFSRMSGVSPMVSVMSAQILPLATPASVPVR